MLRPSVAEARRGTALALAVAIGALGAGGCASLPAAPLAVRAEAQRATTYTASLRVAMRGPSLRGRAAVVVGFRRPDGLRVELPAGAGLRLLAVARGELLTVAFPGERAYYEGPASPEALGALLGVALAPADLMDLLLGLTPAGVRELEVEWGPRAPARLVALLRDGTRLEARVREPELDRPLADAAFAAPLTAGWQRLTLDEARGRWAQ